MVKTTIQLYKTDVNLENAEKDFIHYLNNYATSIRLNNNNSNVISKPKKYAASSIQKYLNNLLRHNGESFINYIEMPTIEYDTVNHGTYSYAITHWNFFLKHKLENKELYTDEKVNTTIKKITTELNKKYELQKQKRKNKKKNKNKKNNNKNNNKITQNQNEINIIEKNRLIKKEEEEYKVKEYVKKQLENKKEKMLELKNKINKYVDVYYSSSALVYFIISDNKVINIIDENELSIIKKNNKINKKQYENLSPQHKKSLLILLEKKKSKFDNNAYELIKLILTYT